MQLKYHNAQKSQYPQTKMPFLEVPFHFLAFCTISYHSVPMHIIVVFCRFMPFFLTCPRPFKLNFLDSCFADDYDIFSNSVCHKHHCFCFNYSAMSYCCELCVLPHSVFGRSLFKWTNWFNKCIIVNVLLIFFFFRNFLSLQIISTKKYHVKHWFQKARQYFVLHPCN